MPLALELQDRGLRALDLKWRDGQAITFLQNIIARHWLAIDTDEKIFGLAVGELLVKEALDRRAFRNIHIIRETAPFVVNPQNSHGSFLSFGIEVTLKIQRQNTMGVDYGGPRALILSTNMVSPFVLGYIENY